jgi:hypothetical protein
LEGSVVNLVESVNRLGVAGFELLRSTLTAWLLCEAANRSMNTTSSVSVLRLTENIGILEGSRFVSNQPRCLFKTTKG